MIFFVIFTGFVLRFIGLNQSLWLDEAAQAIESARPISEQFDIPADFHPPLFHLLLHFWMQVSTSEIWLRLLPTLLGIISIILMYRIGTLFVKKVITHKTVVFATLFVATSAFHVYYSNEIRPYMLSVVLALMSTYFLLQKRFIFYTVSAILFVYSLYLAPFLLFAHGVYIWFFERSWFRRWIVGLMLTILSFMPWVPLFLKQLKIGTGLTGTLPGWSEAVSSVWYKSLPLTFSKFVIGRITFDNKVFYGILVTGLFLLLIWPIYNLWKQQKVLFLKLATLSFLPVLLAFLVSLFIHILAPQRVIFVLPFFYLLLAAGLEVVGKRTRLMIIAIVIILNGYSLFQYSTNPRFQREQWREAVQYVENSGDSQSVAIFVFPQPFAPWLWYQHGIVQSISAAPAFTVKDEELSTFMPQLLIYDKIFYFHYLTDLTDPYGKSQQFISNLGFVQREVKDLPGVGFITIYEKNFAFR